MNSITALAIVVAVLSTLVCGFFIFLNTRKTKKTMDTLNDMLEAAINDTFTDNSYDESRLSQLEGNLNRFLTSSKSSQRQITLEKEQVKSLISDISHQTKTPIANILLYTQLLQEQEDLTESCKPMVEQIISQTEKLNFLIQSLIKTSRLESGIVRVIPSQNSINRLVEEAIKECENEAGQKQIQIVCESLQPLTAYFDLKWTIEAVYNVLDNAIKYSLKNTQITIFMISYEMFCRIDITDQGIGISEEDLPRIFSRFYRSPAVSQNKGVGNGSRRLYESLL